MDTKFQDRTSSHFRAVSFCLQTHSHFISLGKCCAARAAPTEASLLVFSGSATRSEARLEVTVLACAHRVCDLG